MGTLLCRPAFRGPRAGPPPGTPLGPGEGTSPSAHPTLDGEGSDTWPGPLAPGTPTQAPPGRGERRRLALAGGGRSSNGADKLASVRPVPPGPPGGGAAAPPARPRAEAPPADTRGTGAADTTGRGAV